MYITQQSSLVLHVDVCLPLHMHPGLKHTTKMDLSENYTFCAELNITASSLFEDGTLQPLQITKKGLVLELYQIQKSAKLPWATLAKWVYSCFDQVAPNPACALRRSIETLYAKKINLQKSQSKSHQLKCFLQEPFHLPLHAVKEHSIKKPPPTTQPKIERQAIQIVNKSLAKEVITLQHVCSTQQKQLQIKEDKLKNLERQYKPHNVRRRLQRKDAMIDKQKELTKQQIQEFKKTQQVATKRLQDQLRYYKQKSMKVESDTSDSECDYCGDLEDQIRKLQDKNDELLEENALLNEELCQLKSQSLVTMVDGKYTEEVRLCVMELLALNVGINKVEPVIRAVLRLVNVSCPQLPQHTAISDMLLEARALSQIQLAETLSVTENNTLHSDGTTKFGHKYGSYQISTSDKALTLGVQVG